MAEPAAKPETDAYILGTGDDEVSRLGFQHRVWSELAFALWERAGFGPGWRVADLGCGPGHASLDLAALVGREGGVVGVDRSPRFLAHLEERGSALGLSRIETHVADLQRLDLPVSSLDGAYARWVLCFLDDPRAVLRATARTLRPGGTLAVQDYFGVRQETVAPRHPALDLVFNAIDDSWRRRGGNPDIGGELPGLLAECGFRVVSVVPHVRVGRPGSQLWRWIEQVVHSTLPTLVEMGLVTREQRRAFETEWERSSRDPHALFRSPLLVDVVGIKPEV